MSGDHLGVKKAGSSASLSNVSATGIGANTHASKTAMYWSILIGARGSVVEALFRLFLGQVIEDPPAVLVALCLVLNQILGVYTSMCAHHMIRDLIFF